MTTGELFRPTIGPTRTETDFAGHIAETVATDPEGSWVFVVDNLNIHCSESLVKFVAETWPKVGLETAAGIRTFSASAMVLA